MPGLTLLRDLRATLALAGPLIVAYAGNQLLSVVDTAIVGRLGAEELAGTGLATYLFFAASILAIGTLMGIDPLASQAHGAGRHGAARRHLREAVVLALLLAVPFGALTFALFGILAPLGIDEPTRAQAWLYLLGRVPSILPLLLHHALRGYLQAVGTVRPVMVAVIVANGFNLPVSMVMALGDGAFTAVGLPAIGLGAGWGVFGAAVAATLATLLQVGVLLLALRGIPVPADTGPPTAAGVRTLLRLGWPVGLQLLAEMGIFVTTGLLVGRFGPVWMSGHQVALQLASLSFTVCLGISSATAVRVGHAIGRGDGPGARRAGLLGIGAGAGFMLACSVVFWVAARPLARLIATPPEVVDAAVTLLHIAALFQLFDGLQAVGSGALRGAGDTRAAMATNVVGHWAVGFPLALFLGFRLGLGPVGLWWGLTAGLGLVGVTLTARFAYVSARPIRPAISLDTGGRRRRLPPASTPGEHP